MQVDGAPVTDNYLSKNLLLGDGIILRKYAKQYKVKRVNCQKQSVEFYPMEAKKGGSVKLRDAKIIINIDTEAKIYHMMGGSC